MVQQWLSAQNRDLSGHLLGWWGCFHYQTDFICYCSLIWLESPHLPIAAVNMEVEVIPVFWQLTAEHLMNGRFNLLSDTGQPRIKAADNKRVSDTPDDNGLVSNQLCALQLHCVGVGWNQRTSLNAHAYIIDGFKG